MSTLNVTTAKITNLQSSGDLTVQHQHNLVKEDVKHGFVLTDLAQYLSQIALM